MLRLFPIKGFLGTGATFEADLNLVVQVIMGVAFDRGGCSGETKTVYSSRDLPDDGAALEFADDRVGDVAFVSTTSEASAA